MSMYKINSGIKWLCLSSHQKIVIYTNGIPAPSEGIFNQGKGRG